MDFLAASPVRCSLHHWQDVTELHAKEVFTNYLYKFIDIQHFLIGFEINWREILLVVDIFSFYPRVYKRAKGEGKNGDHS